MKIPADLVSGNLPEARSFFEARAGISFYPQDVHSDKAEQLLHSSPVQRSLDYLLILKWAYISGVIIFSINFIIQLLLLLKEIVTSQKISSGKVVIVELSRDRAPCSFGPFILINPSKYEWETYSQILKHEEEHSKGLHAVDILIAEILVIFLWFNPFAWLLRKLVEQNLEYLTDGYLIDNKRVEPESYQLSLVQVSAPHFPLGVTISYNQSLLSKRIRMINAKKSSLRSSWKYLIVFPVLILSASVFNESDATSQNMTLHKRQTNAFELKLKIPGGARAPMMLQYINAEGKTTKTKSQGSDSVYLFQGSILVPTLAVLMDQNTNEMVDIFIEPGQMTAKARKNQLAQIEVKGSKNEEDRYNLESILQPTLQAGATLQKQYAETNSKLIQARFDKASDKTLDSLDNRVSETLHQLTPFTLKIGSIIYQFGEANPDSHYAAYMASFYVDSWSPDSTRHLFQAFNSTVRNGVYGKKFSSTK